ncbi:ras and Rab interactor 2 [Psammomys obesus]|uniref:ras and Rab interactor 2 n=1 Tax=Psammomys obesus TaxID=48139 RepID=UPI0024532398|nr:ras and Rab interactor 2 [Psammomys obesus]
MSVAVGNQPVLGRGIFRSTRIELTKAQLPSGVDHLTARETALGPRQCGSDMLLIMQFGRDHLVHVNSGHCLGASQRWRPELPLGKIKFLSLQNSAADRPKLKVASPDLRGERCWPDKESRACSRALLGEMSAWTMGARSLDKRGSFFKVKENRIWDLRSAPSLWLPGELQAPETADWSLEACWLNQLGPGELRVSVPNSYILSIQQPYMARAATLDYVVLEKAMHKCILKPLKGHVEAMLKDFHTADGSWKQLKENLQLVRQRNPQELGVFAPTPDLVELEKIKLKFMTMQKMYSPEKKVMLLLSVCKLIYTVMENNSGRMYGADDFLPVLTYVIAQCDMLELDTEIEYMMELLDPSLLQGEGGYYLTSAYGALSLIKNFQEEQAARLLSSEARDTLRQWHKRRTTNRTIPSVDDFQNYLRVAFQEVNSGCTGKTLLVRPYITTEDVCQLCAEKFKVEDPEEYSLFLFVDETWQQLAEDTYPQKIKAELHSRPQPHIFHFVYRRIKSDPYGVIFQNGEDLTPL